MVAIPVTDVPASELSCGSAPPVAPVQLVIAVAALPAGEFCVMEIASADSIQLKMVSTATVDMIFFIASIFKMLPGRKFSVCPGGWSGQ